MTWQELRDDPVLQRLPYRKELSKGGNVIMWPIPPARHGEQVARIGALLRDRRADGEILIDAAIDTADNTKLVDVAWISPARRHVNPGGPSYATAPELCVTVLAPGDFLEEHMLRGRLYLQAGATEFWLCSEPGDMQFFDASGALESSRLRPDFPAKIEVRR